MSNNFQLDILPQLDCSTEWLDMPSRTSNGAGSSPRKSQGRLSPFTASLKISPSPASDMIILRIEASLNVILLYYRRRRIRHQLLESSLPDTQRKGMQKSRAPLRNSELSSLREKR